MGDTTKSNISHYWSINDNRSPKYSIAIEIIFCLFVFVFCLSVFLEFEANTVWDRREHYSEKLVTFLIFQTRLDASQLAPLWVEKIFGKETI